MKDILDVDAFVIVLAIVVRIGAIKHRVQPAAEAGVRESRTSPSVTPFHFPMALHPSTQSSRRVPECAREMPKLRSEKPAGFSPALRPPISSPRNFSSPRPRNRDDSDCVVPLMENRRKIGLRVLLAIARRRDNTLSPASKALRPAQESLKPFGPGQIVAPGQQAGGLNCGRQNGGDQSRVIFHVHLRFPDTVPAGHHGPKIVPKSGHDDLEEMNDV